MSFRMVLLRVILVAASFAAGGSAWSQPLVNIETPLVNVEEGFYEQFGTNWGARGKNWFFNWGAPPPAPAFGGFDPAAQLQGGFVLAGPGFGGHLGFTAGQGNTRTITGVAPNITVMNGGYGAVFDGRRSPFVSQIIPIVGESPIDRHIRLHGVPQLPSQASDGEEPSRESSTPRRGTSSAPAVGMSSAERGERSVAAIRREQEAEAAAERAAFESLVADAAAKAAAQEFTSAASLYTKAAIRSQGAEREHYLALAKEMRLLAKQIR